MKHTLVAFMENKPGVLNRVSGLFRRRNFNIESLTVGVSEIPGISRMTIVVDGDDRAVEQVIKQLRKLINVTRVVNLTGIPNVTRDLVLVRVKTTRKTRAEIMQLVSIFRARVVDVTLDSLMIEMTGPEDRIESLLNLLEKFGVLELARTGWVTMARGEVYESREHRIQLEKKAKASREKLKGHALT